MALLTYAELDKMNDEAFESAIVLDPDVLTQFDQDGETLLHVAINKGHIRFVKRLIQCGVPLDQANFQGVAAWCLASRMSSCRANNLEIAQYLVQQFTDFSMVFPLVSFKETLVEASRKLIRQLLPWWGIFLFIFLSSLVLVLIGIGISGLLAVLSSLTFLSGLYVSLWLGPSLVVFLSITVCVMDLMNYMSDFYFSKQPSGYIGEQRWNFIQAIETNDLGTIDTILKENINWIFARIIPKFLSKSAIQLLSEKEEGRASLIQYMSAIMQNEAALNHLFNEERHRELLTQYPELLRAAIDAMPITRIAHHQSVLFHAFMNNINWFREEAEQSVNMLAKLIAVGLWVDKGASCSFISDALNASTVDTPLLHFSLANVALRGLYGAPVDLAKARAHFKQVSREDLTLYRMAQKELIYMSLLAAGKNEQSEQGGSKEEKKQRVIHTFQALSHASQVLEIEADSFDRIGREIQNEVRSFMCGDCSIHADVSQDKHSSRFSPCAYSIVGDSDAIYDDWVQTASLDWTAENGDSEKGDSLIEIAAKLRFWDLVSMIFRENRTSVDDKQYINVLRQAVLDKNEATVKEWVKDPAFNRIARVDSVIKNTIIHEAVRVGDMFILEPLLTSESILTLEVLPSKGNDLTPIHLSAVIGRWNFVKAIAEKYPARPDGSDQYFAALLKAISAKKVDVVKLLIQQGTLCSKIDSKRGNISLDMICHQAILLNDEGILQELLQFHSDLSCKNKTGETPIVFAARLGFWVLVNVIANAHATTEDDRYDYGQALFLAIQAGQTGVVLNLLRQGACRDKPYQDPLTKDTIWHAAVRINHLEILNALLQHVPLKGLEVKTKSYVGVLELAATKGYWSLVDAILKTPAAAKYVWLEYDTVLFWAFRAQQVDIADKILQYKCFRRAYSYLKKQDSFENTVWHAAIQFGNLKLLSTLMEQTESSIQFQCLYENTNKNGETPYALAVKCGHQGLIKWIDAKYPNPSSHSNQCVTTSNQHTQSEATCASGGASLTGIFAVKTKSGNTQTHTLNISSLLS